MKIHKESICQNPECGKPTGRYHNAKYCWDCAKKFERIRQNKYALQKRVQLNDKPSK